MNTFQNHYGKIQFFQLGRNSVYLGVKIILEIKISITKHNFCWQNEKIKFLTNKD